MQTNNRNKIKAVNEQQLHERLKILTTTKELDDNPINDIIEGPAVTAQQDVQQVDNRSSSTESLGEIEATIETAESTVTKEEGIAEYNKARMVMETEVEVPENLSSLQNRFGVRKIKRPIKDAQLTARIESVTLKRFKEIVKTMYYPDKPNINETVTQIIRAFVEEYDKNNGGKK